MGKKKEKRRKKQGCEGGKKVREKKENLVKEKSRGSEKSFRNWNLIILSDFKKWLVKPRTFSISVISNEVV